MLSVFTNKNNNHNYTQAEIELASAQTKEALALVSKMLYSTKTALTDEILPKHVGKPVKESFNYVNVFLTEGKKNEKDN